MSTIGGQLLENTGIPELTPLGRQLEALRLERGFSKQSLARHAGTSRQQLWRVMTGKSELTGSLCERLAEALGIDSRALRNAEAFTKAMGELAARPSRGRVNARIDEARGGAAAGRETGGRRQADPPSLLDYLGDPVRIERTLATLPPGDVGRRLKRRVLDAIEDAAADASAKLPPAFFALRGRVVNGEL